MQVIKTLLVLFSTQLYATAGTAKDHPFIDTAMRPSTRLNRTSEAALMQAACSPRVSACTTQGPDNHVGSSHAPPR